MFFGAGYKEHLIVVESSPYGQGTFAGGVEILSVGSEKKLAMMMGDKTQLEIAMNVWETGITEIGELFLHADVSMLMDNPLRPMLRAPALFMPENGQVKCIPNDEEKAYSLCYPGDETHKAMVELGKALEDYERLPDKAEEVTAQIARYLLTCFNLPAQSQIRYLNFKTGEVFGVNYGTDDVH